LLTGKGAGSHQHADVVDANTTQGTRLFRTRDFINLNDQLVPPLRFRQS